jgi:predicted dehydrogenase
MSEAVRVVVVALGGYGQGYVGQLLDTDLSTRTRIVAGVDPTPDHCSRIADLRAMNVPVFATMEDFARAKIPADLAVIASPIHYHCPQTVAALDLGMNVLCEKPMCATVQEADRMIAARDRAGKFAAIGYQMAYSTPFQSLKRDILAGVLGRAARLKCLCPHPRTEEYYGRNNWAGMQKTSGADIPVCDDGRQECLPHRWILDSPVNNAVAHMLHIMLYVLGPTRELGATPVDVVAELYRANPITNYDTAALRAHTEDGTEILFYASHAVDVKQFTAWWFEFEKATVTMEGTRLVARLKDGTVRDYGELEGHLRKLHDAVDAVRGTGGGTPPVGQLPMACSLEAARAQTVCMNGAQESREIVDFPKPMVRVAGAPGKRLTWVPGLATILQTCCEQSVLPSEADVSWAKPGRVVDLRGYTQFPMRR